jgi:hypothetical protein
MNNNKPSLSRYRRTCSICGHSRCAEIETDFITWRSPPAIAKDTDYQTAAVLQARLCPRAIRQASAQYPGGSGADYREGGEVDVTAAAVVGAVPGLQQNQLNGPVFVPGCLSEIGWLESGFLGDTSQHHRAKFIAVIERPCVARKVGMAEFLMRACLTNESPANFEKRLVNEASFSARPLTHAILRSRLMEFGGFSFECSTSSATDRRAMA